MSSLLCLVASYLVNALWEVAAIGGAGWVASHLLKRLGPHVQHVTWVATLGLAVVAPALPLCRALLGTLYLPRIVDDYPSIAFVAAQTGGSTASSSILLPLSLIQVLIVFYLGTLLYFAARLGWLLHRTITFLREAEPVALEPEREELWNRSKRAFSVNNALILRSKRISGPVTLGLMRPILLVPEGFDGCTSHDFLAALAHECAHMKRRDFQKNLFYEFGALFIAFHPVTWMVKSQIAQTREMICDGMAIEKLIDRQTYARSLLRLVTMIPFTAKLSSNAIGIFEANILEKRIMMMNTKKQHFSPSVRYFLIATEALFLLSVAGGSGAKARVIEAQMTSAPASSESVKKGRQKDLTCTYWNVTQNRGYPGTCGIKKADKKNYYCFLNGENKLSQPQSACATKLGK